MPIHRRARIAGACLLAAPDLRLHSARAATTLRWAIVLPNSHPSVAMRDKVAKDVAGATGGAATIQTFPSGQPGGSRD